MDRQEEVACVFRPVARPEEEKSSVAVAPLLGDPRSGAHLARRWLPGFCRTTRHRAEQVAAQEGGSPGEGARLSARSLSPP
jgi:hypothetical protein